MNSLFIFRIRVVITRNPLFFLPKLGHILQSLALGLRNELPNENGGNDTDNTIQAISEPIAHTVGERYKRGGDNPVEDPLESNGDGYSRTTDSIREHLCDENPADRSPREHEGCRIYHDRYHAK